MPFNAFQKDINSIYRDLTAEDATKRISSMKSELRASADKLKKQYVLAESRRKGSLASQLKVIEQKAALLDKRLQAPQAHGLPQILPRGPSGSTPGPEVSSDGPTGLVAETSTAHAVAEGGTAPSPQVCAPSTATSSSHPCATPLPRPLSATLQPNLGSSTSSMAVVEGQELKPTVFHKTPIDVGLESGSEMKLLSPEESRAMVNLLNATADETVRASSMKTQKHQSNEGGKPSTKKQVAGSGSRSSGKRTRSVMESHGGGRDRAAKKTRVETAKETTKNGKAKSSGKGREEPRDPAGMEGVTSTNDERETQERLDEGSKGSEEGGSIQKVRKRAEKEQKVGWSYITVPARIQAGAIVDARIRVLTYVDESESARQKFDREHHSLVGGGSQLTETFVEKGWEAIHNYITAGMNPPCAILARCKQFRWYCREVGAISRLLIWSIFINRTKRTRCHFHALTDRGSVHNDQRPKVSKATKEPSHIVTGVGLLQNDEVLASKTALDMWGIFKSGSCEYELPGARDEAKKIFTTIGKLGEEDLLSFFRLQNGRRYLDCGCDLDHATFDFFLWKVAPSLFSETVPDAVECIGTPWDVRMRPTLITLFSSMGLSPDNLDTVMKYNIKGEQNDLTSAPEFVREFWTLNRALKEAQWPKAGPPTTPPRRRRRKMEFIDPEDIQDGEAVEFESDEENVPQDLGGFEDEGGGGSLCGGANEVRGEEAGAGKQFEEEGPLTDVQFESRQNGPNYGEDELSRPAFSSSSLSPLPSEYGDR